MLALSLETARDTALIVAAIAIGLALVSAWVIKAIVSKLVTAAVLVALAVAVWTQRASLDDCAGDVRANLAAGAVNDTTCTFFSREVTVPGPRPGNDT